MPIDRVDARSAETMESRTQLTQAVLDAYSDNFSKMFKSNLQNGSGGSELDCASNDIYRQSASSDSSAKAQESSEDARPTPLAERQRTERLAQNKDLDQSGTGSSEKVSNSSGDTRKQEEPDKSQETHEDARPTPLAQQQRLERLAHSQDVQQTAGEKLPNVTSDSNKPLDPDKSQEIHDDARPTPLAQQQRLERLAHNQDVQQSGFAEKHNHESHLY